MNGTKLESLRITFVAPPVSMSGGIRVIAIYAKMLAEFGHRVVVVSPPAAPISLKQKLKSLLKHQVWPVLKPSISHLDALGLDHRVLSSHRPVTDQDVPDADIVIATWWETAEWVHALNASKGVKIYFIQHHEVFDLVPEARCRATYRLSLHKIVIARWLAELMHDEYDDADVDLVPNSVDHQQFFASQRGKQLRPTLGFLYHKASLKGVDVTLSTVAVLREQYPNLRVLCFGSHAPDSLATLAEQLNQQLRERDGESKTILSAHLSLIQDGSDNQQLEPMAKTAKAVLEQEELMVTADAGYSNGEQFQACDDAKITAYVPANRGSNKQGDETPLFGRGAFT